MRCIAEQIESLQVIQYSLSCHFASPLRIFRCRVIKASTKHTHAFPADSNCYGKIDSYNAYYSDGRALNEKQDHQPASAVLPVSQEPILAVHRSQSISYVGASPAE